MKAWSIKEPGNREVLELREFAEPVAQKGELLVQVKAAGVNRTDTITRGNSALTPPYPILGVEVSGVVVANHSTDWTLEVGTRVAGLVNHGGYGEYVTMPADRAIRLPDSMTFEEGAAVPEVFLTAYQTLYLLGELENDEKVLIHAAGSGVGTAAIQLARQLSDATIFATAGSSEKLSKAKALGADVAVNYKESDFAEEIKNHTDGKGVDVILDFVGAQYWDQNLRSAAVDARWVLIGTLGGAMVENVSLIDLMKKRIALKGTLLTPRSDAYKAQLTKEFSKEALPLFNEGSLKPVIHSVIPFGNLPEAHRQMEDNENIGKIILSLEKKKAQ